MQFIDVHTHTSSTQKDVFSIENKYPNSKDFSKPFSIGIHPWYISEDSLQNDLATVEKLVISENCYALGECGLDRISATGFSLQLEVFKQQIQLSEKYNKPLIIHCVKAFQEIIQLKKEIKPKQPWIVHGFNKNYQIALDLIQHQICISFGESLLKNKKLQETFLKLPLDFLFLETDTSEESIKNIYKTASELRKIEKQIIIKTVKQNFSRIFKR
ncbi:TatD family hydrolase [Tenacibaculum caenipelagi]|uniref:TatD DNase family protein n=1 Tax=Tenacibaculum caenipelagi TaxID=1325435 RepID=A0A4R6TI44_9FLAO|nr:TatD family hydrolase [Tenacibaculum caenipelagi]TDQ30293.1 TatD DNase family protein [Tenacibaculum caenipelagi]